MPMARLIGGAAICLAILSASGLAALQTDDNPDRIHFRAGYFATPVEIEGHEQVLLISSIEILCESLDESGGQGTFLIDQGQLEFNEFGDATPVVAKPERYQVSLERMETEQPTRWLTSSRDPRIDRAIYKLVFEDDFCDLLFYLNLSMDGVRPSRLVQCRAENADPLTGPGSKSARVYQLSNLGFQTEPLGSEDYGDKISLRTPALQLVPGKTTAGISVAGKPGGAGTLLNDRNRTSLGNYGDSGMQTLVAYSPGSIRLVENVVEDPQQRGRRVFDITGRPIESGREDPTFPVVSYSVVVSPEISGEHRLIIRHDGVVAHVVPLNDQSWQRYATKLNSMTNEASIETIMAIRKLAGNAFSFGMDNGTVSTIRLTGDVSDEVLHTVAELEDLTGLELSGCPDITASGLEVIGQMDSLQHLEIRNTLVTDRTLQLAGQLPQLVALSIYHERKNLNEFNQITESGVSHLANATHLNYLLLSGENVTDRAVASLKENQELEWLSFYATSVSLGGLVKLWGDLPECEISSSSYENAESFQNVELAKGKTGVSLSGHFQEEEFVPLARLMNLEELRLPLSASDQTLKVVSRIGTLRKLRFQTNWQITDRGIEHLAALTELRDLSLSSCKNLTDDCANHLQQLTNLETLSVGGTKLGDRAIDQLRSALPDCKVER